MVKTTVITNVYNEEYLLPFWLTHHRDMFDDVVIIDHGCTDRSLDICKELCPRALIRKTRNDIFDSEANDLELMDVENTIEGVKVVLNTTEFLFCKRPLKEIFSDSHPASYAIWALSPYSKTWYTPANNEELFKNFFNDDVVFHLDRWGVRLVHSFQNGAYTVGRHNTRNPSAYAEDMYLVWMGFYPLNEKLLARKLQIKDRLSQYDKDHGNGYQHLWDRTKMLEVNEQQASTGVPLSQFNPGFYDFLQNGFGLAKTS
jgi:glycosyltransferase involved in cell wall biosynthesis